MSIASRIEADFSHSMKAKQPQLLSALRLLKSSLKNAEITKKEALTDDEIIQVLRTEIKRRRESGELYRRAGDKERAQVEDAEIAIYERYMPQALTEDALRDMVQKVIVDTGALGAQDIGKVMGAVMKEVAGKADGGEVKKLVQQMLNN